MRLRPHQAYSTHTVFLPSAHGQSVCTPPGGSQSLHTYVRNFRQAIYSVFARVAYDGVKWSMGISSGVRFVCVPAYAHTARLCARVLAHAAKWSKVLHSDNWRGELNSFELNLSSKHLGYLECMNIFIVYPRACPDRTREAGEADLNASKWQTQI